MGNMCRIHCDRNARALVRMPPEAWPGLSASGGLSGGSGLGSGPGGAFGAQRLEAQVIRRDAVVPQLGLVGRQEVVVGLHGARQLRLQVAAHRRPVHLRKTKAGQGGVSVSLCVSWSRVAHRSQKYHGTKVLLKGKPKLQTKLHASRPNVKL